MDKVKWGIVGTGNIASKFAADLSFSKHGELTAVASRNISSADQFAQEFGCSRTYGSYEEIYADNEIEAIYVATPHNSHFQNASDALKSGKAVLCEKPMTVNLGECQQLIEIAKDSKQYLMEGMWSYFLPSIRKAVEWVESGKIGEVTHVKADFGFPAHFNPQHRLFNPALAGGSILDIGIYPIALNWLIFKEDPIKMTVLGRNAPTGVDMDVCILFEYPDAASQLTCSIRSKLPNSAYIAGTKGSIEIPEFWMSHEAYLYDNKEVIEHFIEPRKSFGFNYQIDEVCRDIRNGKLQSDVMPHPYSLKLQEHMQSILDKIND